MNRYGFTFRAKCPGNGRIVTYRLTIETDRMIMVEEIVAAAPRGPTYHEPLADKLFARFGGVQRLTAHHHGVDVETVRP